MGGAWNLGNGEDGDRYDRFTEGGREESVICLRWRVCERGRCGGGLGGVRVGDQGKGVLS